MKKVFTGVPELSRSVELHCCVGGPQPGPSGWAHVGPKWVGPRRAQVGGPKVGGPKWAQAGPKPEIWDPKNSKK